MGLKIRLAAGVGAATVLMASQAGFAAEPICDKSQIRLVNSMREIAQPYHGLVNAGGEAVAKWAGIAPNNYVLQLNQGDSDKQVSLMRSLLATNATCTVFNVEPDTDLVVQ